MSSADPLLAAYLGPNFRRRFFNPVAAIAPFWPAWRGYWGAELLTFLLFALTMLVMVVTGNEHDVWKPVLVPFLAVMLFHGFTADALRLKHAELAKQRVLAQGLEGDAAIPAMREAARPSVPWFLTFALVGLVGLVYFVFPIVAFRDHHGENLPLTNRELLRQDLERLDDAQTLFWTHHSTYTTNVDSLFFTQRARGVLVIEAESLRWRAELSDTVLRRRCVTESGEPPVCDSIP